MAVICAMRCINQSPSAMRGTIEYCLQEKKTFDKDSGKNLITRINCIPENAYSEFMATKAVYQNTGGVNFYHFTQAFSPKEKITPEQVHELGIEFAKRAWPGHEVLVCTHMDEPQLHSNFVVNSVNFENGSKIHFGPNSIKLLRDMSDEICSSHGFSTLAPYEKGDKSISTREYRAAQKGQSWKFRLMGDINKAMQRSGNRENFIKEMARHGYKVIWTPERKYITFTCPNEMKCRDIKLHDNKYLKERLEHEFKIREQLTKQLFNGGTDSKEFFESGGIRTADISGGDMLHTDEAKVAGSATDEGHGEFSAEVVQTDSNIGNEGTSGGNGTDNGGQAFDEQQKHYEQPDINECGNCSEDAEFVGTGWEESRAIYFEILRYAGRRSEQTQRDDKYAENASAQVFGDYNRGGNTILDIGFGAVSAVASLMDNDDCDDPEEKKKKLDAKDAGSNFGFALGVAVGLVGGLIAKSVKQDEEVVEKPPEEPKEDKEIDIDTYEESEDMDEDEGFTMQM